MPTSVWRGYISFGLVMIPVRLYRAARSERVKLREVYSVSREPSEPPDITAEDALIPPVEQTPAVAPAHRVAAEESGQTLPATALGKGYEYDKGRFVALDRDELKALAPKTSTAMELLEFVDLASVDPVYFETSYYVQPEPAGQKPYALLFQSLKESGLVGVAQIAMHRREHIILVRSGASGLIAHTMFFTSEVRADQEYKADTALVNSKELALANTLVSALAGNFTPEKYHDTYREELEKLIAAKVAGQPLTGEPSALPAKAAVDIMEALRKSLAGLKKPPAAAAAQDVQVGQARRRTR